MKILDSSQINQKVNRLAIEILEHNYREKEIILAGINKNGVGFAKMLQTRLKSISDMEFTLCQIKLNPANPIEDPITLDQSVGSLKNKVILVVDDVANTGRTIFYACKPIMDQLPKKVEVAVLVDREHKAFPIKADYVGLSLATTAGENIDVRIKESKNQAVYLA